MAQPPAGRGAYVLFVGILGMLTAVAPLSIDMYLPALPRLADVFAVDAGYVQYSLSLFFVGMAVGQFTYGPLSDRFGRRPILYVGLCIYIAAAVSCALAESITWLIASRAVQGLGAAAVPVMARAIVRDRYEGAKAASVMSFVVMVMATAPLVAPILGGFILAVAGWPVIFWVLVVYALACLVALTLFIEESHTPLRGAAAPSLPRLYGSYLALLARPAVLLYLICGGLMFGALFCYVTASAFVYIVQFGVPRSQFGFYFSFNVIAMLIGTFANGSLVQRFGYRNLLGVAVINTLTCSLVLLLTSGLNIGGLWGVAIPLFFLLGTVGVAGANTVAGLLDMAPDAAGAASALFGVIQFASGALTSTLVGLAGGDALAMASVMVLSAGGALAAYIGLLRLGRPGVLTGR